MINTLRQKSYLDEFNREIFDLLPGNAALISADGEILEVNESWKSYARNNHLGWENYGIGKNYLTDWGGNGGVEAIFTQNIIEVIKGIRDSYSYSYECSSPEEIDWFEMRIIPFGGALDHFLILHRNVTEAKSARLKIITRERLLKSISNSIPGAVVECIVDQNGEERLLCNQESYKDRYGNPLQTVIEDIDGLWSEISREDKQRFHTLINQSKETLEPISIDLRAKTHEGAVKWLNLRVSPSLNPDNSILWHGVLLDITEQQLVKTRLEIESQRRISNMESILALAQTRTTDFIKSCHQILEEANRHLFSFRSSLWLIDSTGGSLIRACSHDDSHSFTTSDKTVSIPDNHLLFEKQVVFPDVTQSFSKEYLTALNNISSDTATVSTLFTPIFMGGRLKGILTHKVNKFSRIWDDVDKEYSLALAQIILGSLQKLDHDQIEMSLVFSEAKNRAILSAMPDILIHINREGICMDIHKPQDFLPQIEVQKILKNNFFSIVPVNAAATLSYLLEESFNSKRVERMEFFWNNDKENLHLEVRITSISDTEAIMIIRDITTRKELERKILEISRMERTRIGSDLHDGLGQELTAVSFLCSALSMKVKTSDSYDHETADQLDNIHKHVQRCIDQTRLMARGLSPFQLEQRGLTTVLQDFLKDIQCTFNIDTVFESSTGFELNDPVIAEHIFRIIQEATNNAIKHGHTKKIHIKVINDMTRCIIIIFTDGAKWKRPSPDKRGVGMEVMRFRAGLIGAELDFQPHPQGGLEIICTLPLAKTDK